MKSIFAAAITTLALSSPTHADGSFIVDVDAKYNGHKNPVVKFLPAGEYKIRFIGPKDGGKYTARNAWNGRTMGCFFENGEICHYGWQHGALLRSPTGAIPEATGGNRLYNDLYGCHLNLGQKVRAKYNVQYVTWASPELALNAFLKEQESGSECTFSMEEEGFIHFFDGDYITGDNKGGTSYSIESVNKVIPIDIDIKPGSDRNPLNINGKGVIPVAILGNETFDVSIIDIQTLTLAGTMTAMTGQLYPSCGLEYVNDDDYQDMVCHFRDDTSLWEPGDGEAKLSGVTLDGTMIEGSDRFEIVGKNKPQPQKG